MTELFADLDRWVRDGEEIALATLVAVRGSAPRLPNTAGSAGSAVVPAPTSVGSVRPSSGAGSASK